MKILLLGGNGQIGRELQRSLPQLGTLTTATRDGVGAQVSADFETPARLADLVLQLAPDVVVNAAAYTAVDKAEVNPDTAFRINAEAPAALAYACAASGALLLHYSTDYVFDGRSTLPYREDAATAPLGVYGASKLAGEQAIQSSGARHAILRTAWVYAARGKNFLLTMLRMAAERDVLKVVADQLGAPTSARWIADASVQVLKHGVRNSDTWHLVSAGQTSWHGFAQAIVLEAHAQGLLQRMPQVLPIATSDYPTPALRPAYSVLDTAKLQREFSIRPPDWQAALGATLQELVVESGF